MSKFLDAYVYLLIATISFVAPLITFMLSAEGVTLLNDLFSEKAKQIGVLAAIEIDKGTPEQLLMIQQTRLILTKVLADDIKMKNLLNAKRQASRLFLTLIISLVLQMLYFLLADKEAIKNVSSVWLWLTFVFSLFFFVRGIIRMGLIIGAMSDAKEIIGQLESKLSITNDEIVN